MLDRTGLKAEMVRCGYTQKSFAEALGMSSKTFYLKMKKGVFGSNEIEKAVELLNLKNPTEIFFANKVTLKDTNRR